MSNNTGAALAAQKGETEDMGNVSDGYHTFNELYEHRHALFLKVMQMLFLHGGSTWVDIDPNTPDWFLAGFDSRNVGQVSYHLPMRLLPVAQQWATPGYQRRPYDGYTADDVLRRLQALAGYGAVQP